MDDEYLKELDRFKTDEFLKGLTFLQDSVLSIAQDAWQAYMDGSYWAASSLSQVLLDQIWENLNIGHWKDVDINWRRLYSCEFKS